MKKLIFDCGGVLVNFSPAQMVACVHPQNQADAALLHEIIFRDWAALDAGSTDYDQYVRKTLDLLPQKYREAARAVLYRWPEIIEPMDGMPEIMKQLYEKGYEMYILSNAPTVFSAYKENFYFAPYIRGFVFSADIRMVKPDRKIYRHLLEQFSLKAEECIFFDDREDNIEAARMCGMEAVRIIDPAAQVRKVLGL